MFLGLDFGCVLFGGNLQINQWYVPALLFVKAILFGGIEEIGWRYTFQPILEERFSYLSSTAITFLRGEYGIFHIFILKVHYCKCK